jgi:hypothetical protein
MTQPCDHAELIQALGGGAIVATGLSDHSGETVLPVTVRAWLPRNRIPPEYWPGIIELAAAKGIAISADWLMRTTPARKRPEPEAAEAA